MSNKLSKNYKKFGYRQWDQEFEMKLVILFPPLCVCVYWNFLKNFREI